MEKSGSNAQTSGHGFGTAPVFLASVSTILGAIMFLRFGYAVGHTGLFGALAIILLGHLVTIPTGLAESEIATNRRVEGGGEYFMISRSFGLSIGASIGIALYISQAISVAFYMIAFAEAFRPVIGWLNSQYGLPAVPRIISLPATILLIGLMLTKGAALGVKALWAVVALLGTSLVLFFLGKPAISGQALDFTATTADPHPFMTVFAICFPAFTGMTAGVGLSGDLKDPRRSIPLGVLSATIVGMLVYVAIAFKLRLSATSEGLAAEPLIMSQIALWGPIIPIGLAAATLSSAIGSFLVAPRTLQALAKDRAFPAGWANRLLSVGKGDANEPVNATVLTSVIALVFVSLGDVDFVAQIISMFFMITYGAICTISFLEHFAGNPSYRPSFRSRWYISLFGAAMCLILMFQMSVLYAALSLLMMLGIYTVMRSTQKGSRGFAAIFQGTMFQLTRGLQILLQKSRASIRIEDWRPAFLTLVPHTSKRLAAFDLSRWLAHRYGFGMLIHYTQGYLTKDAAREARRTLTKLIQLTEVSESAVFVDTMVSPSFKTALAQMIQLPGISGMENNSVLFEFAADETVGLPDIVEGCQLCIETSFNLCVLRSSEHHFGYKRHIHVWLTVQDSRNANLMLLLSYILLGHPEWSEAEITVFAAYPASQADEGTEELKEMIASGRLPIASKNIRSLPYDADTDFDEMVASRSADADLALFGFTAARLQERGAAVFCRYPNLNEVVFVYANQPIVIS